MNGPLRVCEVMWGHRGSRNFSAQPHQSGWPQEDRRERKAKQACQWGGREAQESPLGEGFQAVT